MLTPLLACAFDEVLPEKDFVGTVIVARAAATRTTWAVSENDEDGDGEFDDLVSEVTTDPRLIGPIYLGAFSGIDTVSFPYPHPAMGPVITDLEPGNTFPYGGTTVGRPDFACYEDLACRVTTGRFTDYEDILDFFRNRFGDPVRDADGNVVDYPSTFQQECFDHFRATGDEEMSFIGDLDFEENADGDFESTFSMAHTYYAEGMVGWGFMDAPEIESSNPDANGTLTTCVADGNSRQWNDYDEEYFEGRTRTNILNYPSVYVTTGDWVSDGSATFDSPEAEITIEIGTEVGAEGDE